MNSRHTVLGSTDCNVKGQACKMHLLEFLGTKNLDILNIICKATFKNAVKKDSIDIALASAEVWSRLRTWKVSEEISMSDRNYITFKLAEVNAEVQFGRNPGKTDWQRYVDELADKVSRIPVRLSTQYEIASTTLTL